MSFTKEGPEDGRTKIIALELAVSDPYGREHELEMFPCAHTLPPNGEPGGYRPPRRVRVTLHTSDGDVTLIGNMS